LVVLSVTQLIGWGTISLPAIIGRQMAADLKIDISLVFAASSILFVVMGLCAPVLARAFIRFGARRVMMAGTMVAAPAFVLLSAARGPLSYAAAWALLGAACSATLTTAAYIVLNEIAGRNAARAIGALMLVTGLSSSVFWPTTSFLTTAIGWRGTCLVYAAMMVLVCLPLYAFGLPRRPAPVDEAGDEPQQILAAPIPRRATFHLVASAIALSAFVTFGFNGVLIELLKVEGLSPAEAIAFGSMLGVIQVSARAINFLGGGAWDGITTGLLSGGAVIVAMLLLMAGNGTYWTVAVFVLLYGLGSGALVVARATIPLVFYDKAEFARVTSKIALPVNFACALSPPLLVRVLTQLGADAVLGIAMLCCVLSLAILLLLGRRRPSTGIVQ
jgi:predicted MFS family arabinose efflux permease